MDFAFDQDQQALAELARSIFKDHADHDRLKVLEAAGEWYADAAWEALAKAHLLGVAIPEEYGGSGLGLLEVGILLEEVGRAVAPVPVLAAVVLGGLPLAAAGDEAQRRRWLPGIASGVHVVTAALLEPDGDDPLRPATTATRDGAGWRLDGVKHCIPAGDRAVRVLVPAAVAGVGVGLFLVDPAAPGVRVERQVLTNREPHARLTLEGVPVGAADVLGDPRDGAASVHWLHQRALAGYCALQIGICDRALRMTAEYTTKREQFGRPLATFQAVQQRAADAYIDLEAIRLTTWEALGILAADRPADDQVTIAKVWASEGGQRIAVATGHLHGGIGVDVDYPLHRYFLWAKHIELMLGPGTAHLARLGTVIARGAPAA
jgi:alkylation response protein AidB-like acyl-CoA dehydrogenase